MSNMDLHLSDVSYALAQMNMEEVDALHRVIETVRMRRGVLRVIGEKRKNEVTVHLQCVLAEFINLSQMDITDMPWVRGTVEAQREMFEKELHRWLKPEDGVLAISRSGEEKEALLALKVAAEMKLPTAALTGCSYDSEINRLRLDALVHVPEIEDIRVQEDVHLIVCHAVTRMYK